MYTIEHVPNVKMKPDILLIVSKNALIISLGKVAFYCTKNDCRNPEREISALAIRERGSAATFRCRNCWENSEGRKNEVTFGGKMPDFNLFFQKATQRILSV